MALTDTQTSYIEIYCSQCAKHTGNVSITQRLCVCALGPIVLNNTGDARLAGERGAESYRADPAEVINQFAIDIDIRNYLRVVKGRGQMPLIGLAAV